MPGLLSEKLFTHNTLGNGGISQRRGEIFLPQSRRHK
ncbi:hypothetical protein BACCAP_02314 [Pseudoflavonifractor capillosus ATCC 29799]|uniref:Uncharacterized protein n=1 Tax=Pseudoflavonifractor capillosus ATCC 29799 TaxID=411467 RepID=A6NVS0_9FIRM|nr:hypothetical protein BACCAP_02314 [Pseudoflavonifractor capillosus ATCC 29799]